MQFASFFDRLSASHFARDLFVIYLGIVAIGIFCFWIARLIKSASTPGKSSEGAVLEEVTRVEAKPQLKASELTWLKKHQIEELAKLLDADVLGLHRMKAIKVLCQSGLQEQHLDAVS